MAQWNPRAGDGAGRLGARPGVPATPGSPGVHRLQLNGRRDGLLYVPAGHDATRPAPLVVLLHGAGGSGANILPVLQPLAAQDDLLVLAPDSRDRTWDLLIDGYGPDVAFLDRALAWTFARYAVDPACLAIGGFSDGASYALSLGLDNGDLFAAILAFSPGFMAPERQVDAPRIFISHGTDDHVLPIARCSRRIVPQLQRAGYTVRYEEFPGPHTVPPHLAAAAVAWFLAPPDA